MGLELGADDYVTKPFSPKVLFSRVKAVSRRGTEPSATPRTVNFGEFTLEIDGYSANDVDQGATGSCYFLSALAGTADKKESIIEDMFTDNGDGTWSVRFITNGQADYVTVDNMMATRSNGTYLYANAGGDNGAINVGGASGTAGGSG